MSVEDSQLIINVDAEEVWKKRKIKTRKVGSEAKETQGLWGRGINGLKWGGVTGVGNAFTSI